MLTKNIVSLYNFTEVRSECQSSIVDKRMIEKQDNY